MLEGPALAHGVQPADEAAQLAQRLGVFQLGLAPRAASRHGVAVAEAAGQRRRHAEQAHAADGFAQHQRRHHRHLGFGQFQRVGVLFEDLRVAPAARPVELGHHGAAVFQEYLEDAVLVGVELQHAPVATQAYRVESVQDLLRVEPAVVHLVADRRVVVVDHHGAEAVAAATQRTGRAEARFQRRRHRVMPRVAARHATRLDRAGEPVACL
jgi:hypothetical protein